MKFYDFPFAPNPTKVRVFLAEKGLSDAVETVVLNLVHGENRTPEMLAKNPMGGLPFLELDDGTVITESLPIMEYFEELHPEPCMIGRTPVERARVRSLERMIEVGVLNRAGRLFFNTSPVFAGRGQIPESGEQARRELPGALEIVSRAIGTNAFVAGDHPTIADCTLWAGLLHAERAGFALPEDGVAELLRWREGFARRPSVAA